MTDRLDLALRRYGRIAAKPDQKMSERQAEEQMAWLEQDVCRIVEKLVDHIGFQARVKWPIERLADPHLHRERKHMNAVDRALVGCANALVAFARQGSVWRQLMRFGPHGEDLSEDDPRGQEPSNTEDTEPVPLGLPQVEFIASRPWRDLVSVYDYFKPTAQFNLKEPDYAQWAQFNPCFNPQLPPLGDYVSRSMRIRVDYWKERLLKFLVRCDTARQRCGEDFQELWNEVEDRWAELNERYDSLMAMCYSGQEARVRDSSIALLQVFASLQRKADIGWLGLPVHCFRNVGELWHRVIRRRDVTVAERTAAALMDVAEVYRRPPTPEEVIEHFRRSKRLVLIEDPRAGFWDGDPLAAEWDDHTMEWELLWMLAERAKTRKAVDRFTLSGASSQDAIKHRRSRLKKLIPSELNERIESAGRRTYRLRLDPGEIALLRLEAEERLVDFVPKAGDEPW